LSVDLPLGFNPEVRRSTESTVLILLEDAVRIDGGGFVDCKLEVAFRFIDKFHDFLLVFEELPPDSQFGFAAYVLRIGGIVGFVDCGSNNDGNSSSDVRSIIISSDISNEKGKKRKFFLSELV
jgi:hypothetical protein